MDNEELVDMPEQLSSPPQYIEDEHSLQVILPPSDCFVLLEAGLKSGRQALRDMYYLLDRVGDRTTTKRLVTIDLFFQTLLESLDDAGRSAMQDYREYEQSLAAYQRNQNEFHMSIITGNTDDLESD